MSRVGVVARGAADERDSILLAFSTHRPAASRGLGRMTLLRELRSSAGALWLAARDRTHRRSPKLLQVPPDLRPSFRRPAQLLPTSHHCLSPSAAPLCIARASAIPLTPSRPFRDPQLSPIQPLRPLHVCLCASSLAPSALPHRTRPSISHRPSPCLSRRSRRATKVRFVQSHASHPCRPFPCWPRRTPSLFYFFFFQCA